MESEDISAIKEFVQSVEDSLLFITMMVIAEGWGVVRCHIKHYRWTSLLCKWKSLFTRTVTVSVKFTLCEWWRTVWQSELVLYPICPSNGPFPMAQCWTLTVTDMNNTTVTVRVNRLLIWTGKLGTKWEGIFQSGKVREFWTDCKSQGKSHKILKSQLISDKCYLLIFNI